MSGLYAQVRVALLAGSFTWHPSSHSLMLVGPGYTPNYASDKLLTDIPAMAQLLSTPTRLSGETIEGGACFAANVTWTALDTTAPITGIAILADPVAPATVPSLVCYLDQGAGFGQIANGVAAQLIFDANGVFSP